MSGWSPYGLETYRAKAPKRRLAATLVALAVFAALWALFLSSANEGTFEVGAGKQGTITLKPPEQTLTPTTVSVQPGRATLMAAGPESSEGGRVPPGFAASPYPVLRWLVLYGPLALLAWALRKLLTRPGKVELNYGIYKGAMPPEMILAAPPEHLRPRKVVEAPLFGRDRRAYVGEPE